MHRLTTIMATAVVGLLLAGATAAKATTVDYDFTGTVTVSPASFPNENGATFTAHLSLDSLGSDLFPSDPNTGGYDAGAASVLSLSYAGQVYDIVGAATVTTATPGHIQIRNGADPVDTSGGPLPFLLHYILDFTNPSIALTDAFPVDLGLFGTSTFTFEIDGNPTLAYAGTLAAVPLPNSAFLLGGGLGLLTLFGFRKKHRAPVAAIA